MRQVVKRVGVLSCGKISGIIYTAFGLVAGILVAVFSMFMAALGSVIPRNAGHEALDSELMTSLFGAAAILIFPVMYGVIGFLGGLLGALLYNATAHFVGGIELEVEESALS